MRTTIYSSPVSSTPQWLHDPYSLGNYVPGGARLKANTVTDPLGYVPGGSLVGRTANLRQWILIPPTATKTSGSFTTRNATALTAGASVGDTVFSVADTDGYVDGNVIRVATNTLTIAANGVDYVNNRITTTAAATAAAPVGTVVDLNVVQNLVETLLTVTEITKVSENNEFTLLRPGVMVYLNFLPGFSTFSADYRSTVQSLYQNVIGLD